MNLVGVSHSRSAAEGADILRRASSHLVGEVTQAEKLIDGFGARVFAHKPSQSGEQPFASDDGRYIGFAIGELYGSAGLSELFSRFLENNQSWERVNGQFVLVVFDTATHTTTLINDRFGFYPLFYSVVSGDLYFSGRISSLKEILPHRPALSREGMTEILLFTHHFGNRCLYEGIHRMPPASIMTFAGSAAFKRYWNIVYRPNEKADAAGLADVIALANKRQTLNGRRQGLLLSGGMDSRVAAHGMRGKSVPAFTFGAPGTADVLYAKRICDILGFEHDHLVFQPSLWKQSLPRVAELADGEASIEHYRSVQFHEHISQMCDSIVTGQLGDIIAGSTVKEKHIAPMPLASVADYGFKWSLPRYVSGLREALPAERWNALEMIGRRIITESFDGTENELAADTLCAWNIENRQRRMILVGAHTDRVAFAIRSPFFDHDLFDYMLQVPARHRLRQSMYIRALWMMMPDLRQIPWQKTGIPPNPDAKWVSLRKAMYILMSMAGLGPKRAYVNTGALIRQSFTTTELVAVLNGRQRPWNEFIGPEETQEIVRRHFAGVTNYGSVIMNLLTLTYSE